MSRNLAPIVLFVYNRPWHTRKTLDALKNNQLANQSVLYVYADGPKPNSSVEDQHKISEVRRLIREDQWCNHVHIIESQRNIGLAENIIKGVSEVVDLYGSVIVLEDDIVTAKGFLMFMNDALQLYKEDEKVMHISGYMYPIKLKEESAVFLNVATPWGWATWKRAWKYFESNPLELKRRLSSIPSFDNERFNAGYGNEFTWQLEQNVSGEMKTWAVLWHSSIYLNDGFCLHPARTLAFNIGFDGSGVNCGNEPQRRQQPIIDFLNLRYEPIMVKEDTLKAFKTYYLETKGRCKTSMFKRLLRKFKLQNSD